jgi:hypothetical protein
LRAAGNDPGACAHAAREGAAVLAAWSIDLEGERPGALARATRQLARPAELSASTPAPLVRRPPSRASGLALFMLAAGRPDSAVGWLLVCRELGLLAGEIGRVHRARGELQRAHEIETELHGELEQIRARLDADRPDSGPVELDAETEAARRAREPLGPAARAAPQRPVDADDVEAVRRLIDPTRCAGDRESGETINRLSERVIAVINCYRVERMAVDAFLESLTVMPTNPNPRPRPEPRQSP